MEPDFLERLFGSVAAQAAPERILLAWVFEPALALAEAPFALLLPIDPRQDFPATRSTAFREDPFVWSAIRFHPSALWAHFARLASEAPFHEMLGDPSASPRSFGPEPPEEYFSGGIRIARVALAPSSARSLSSALESLFRYCGNAQSGLGLPPPVFAEPARAPWLFSERWGTGGGLPDDLPASLLCLCDALRIESASAVPSALGAPRRTL